MSLSVIVIAKNAEETIERCLTSVAWADEIVVLDSGSRDATVEIAQRHASKVEVSPDWPGFGPQKNRALALANSEWVLSLDSDEWVPEALRQEIEQAIRSPGDHVAFRMPRLSTFCGRPIHHSGWWPDYVVRLFRRGSGQFSDDLVHERVLVTGPVGTLKTPLGHAPIRDLEQALEKVNAYSSAGAVNFFRAGHRGSLAKAVGRGAWSFFRTYVLRAGFLDGRMGFILAIYNAEATYYRYLKLMLLEERERDRR
ncbi:glycosyltransferase family 2 protein [Pelomicrobium sp.]|uniref:glycosyltransferase family 2 protein n=1 Tax=Pelomicrobium sp. TaxID=2815319 RepID=UPI002FDE4892